MYPVKDYVLNAPTESEAAAIFNGLRKLAKAEGIRIQEVKSLDPLDEHIYNSSVNWIITLGEGKPNGQRTFVFARQVGSCCDLRVFDSGHNKELLARIEQIIVARVA